jgi:hypothetical protein
MKAFFGGQIKQDCRGDLAVVITSPKVASRENYSAFLYPILSEEFVHLTGVRTTDHKVERVYMGVSQRAGERILKNLNDLSGRLMEQAVALVVSDEWVVTPYFLKK